MYLIYKKVKKHRAQKREQAQNSRLDDPSSPKDEQRSPQDPHTFDSESKVEGGQAIAASQAKIATDEQEAETKAQKSQARKYRWRLVAGLFLPYFIASTDVTIIATALPYIASHFERLNQLNWIVTAFTITSTSFIPVWGQLSDVYGRHAVLQTVMVIMMVGAALAAGARAWVMLLFGRALMGVSAAGILNIIKIILADHVTLEENAKNNTIFAIVGGVSFGVGPVIGGALTAVTWRWCFILNIPVAAGAMVAIFLLLRNDLVGPQPQPTDKAGDTKVTRFFKRLRTVDFGGLVLFVAGITLIILGTTWGGATYAWSSAHVIAPIVLGAVLFVSFFLYEYFMEPGKILAKLFPNQEPMIPLRLFRKKDLPLLAWITFATGSAMYSIFYFVGIYFTIVKQYKPSDAGIALLYYLPGIGVGSYMAMFTANVWPKQTWLSIFSGSVLETLGFAILIYGLHTERTALIGGMMGLAGAGTGLRLMPNNLHAAGIWPDQLARAMSVIDFCQPFGGTISLAMMGAVFNNKLASSASLLSSGVSVSSLSSSSSNTQGSTSSLDAINDLPPSAHKQFHSDAKTAVVLSFVAVIPIIALAIVASLALGNVKISKTNKKTESGHLDTDEAVDSRPYLWALLKGPKRNKNWESSGLTK